jgi:methylated-DNA-[protein]-cysteine S-methyltransferase
VLVECTEAGVRRIQFRAEIPASDEDDGARRSSFVEEHPWAARTMALLEDYFAGQAVSFDEVPVDLSGQRGFRREVLETCRRIGYGERTTYKDLAARAGNATAVRAVGSAMSHNPVPIIIPCHRVLRSDGGLGGFSAPGGVSCKKGLLDMEAGGPG